MGRVPEHNPAPTVPPHQPPAWACLAPLAHTSLPRTDTGKPHPVHIPSGGGRLKEAARGLNGVGWTSERREKTLPRMDTGKPPCRAMASVVPAGTRRWCEQLSVSLGTFVAPARTKRWWPVIPARGRAAPHPCRQAFSANKCLYHSQWIRSRQQVWLLHHWVSVAILVGHVTMAGCKLRAQNHAPATEMYARRPSIGGSDDCAGSARPSSHTAPRRSGTP